MCTHGIGSNGTTPQLATTSPATADALGGGAPTTGVAGIAGGGLAASAPELGAILLQLTRAVEALVQALGGSSALTQAPSTFAGSDAAPVALGGGDGGGRGKVKGDKPADKKPKRDGHGDHGGRADRNDGPRRNGHAGHRDPAPGANAAPTAPNPNPPANPTPPADPPANDSQLSDADRTRLRNERDTLNAEAKRLRDLLGKYGGGAGTTTTVNRLEVIDARLREIKELLD